jgi:AdoMet-dependent heme synthase
MEFSDKLKLSYKVMLARALHKYIPLSVGWALTNRCFLKCLYCDVRNQPAFEMSTQQVYSIIEEMSEMGTKFIQFTGGDAILRDDIGKIIKYSHEKGICTTLSCSGVMVPEKIKELKLLERLGLSLDGRKAIHDCLRGEGSFDIVMKAVTALLDNNIKLKLVSVISKLNLGEIDFLLDFALKARSSVLFQPATIKKLYSERANEVCAEQELYRSAVYRIIEYKRKGAPVANSFSGLRHLSHWPYAKKIFCPGGRIFCSIRNNGQVSVCSRSEDLNLRNNNCLEKGFKKAFLDLPVGGCTDCWSSLHIELGCLLSFMPDTILNAAKLI